MPPSPQRLALLARSAQICYLDAAPCSAAGKSLELDLQCFFDDVPVEAFVSHPPGAQLVVFRGTNPRKLHDLLVDAELVRRSWGKKRRGPGEVSHGFADAVDAVFDPIHAALNPRQPLLLAGHSLGGALATYFAARLLWEEPGKWTVAGGLTCGSPRLANGAFASWFDAEMGDRWVRAVNNNDIVTRLPGSLSGYRHVGKVAWVRYDGELVWDPGMWERFKDRLVGRLESLIGEPDIREVPGVNDAVYELVNEKGMAVIRRLLEPAAVSALAGYGVPLPLAKRIVDWAADRTHGGTVFDGLHDHSSELYAEAFERAAQVV